MAITTVNLSDPVSTLVTKTNEISSNLGDKDALATVATSSLVAAINEIQAKIIQIDEPEEIALQVETYFQSNSFDIGTLTAAGNVGIGTTSPSALLHLASNAPYINFEDVDNNQDWQLQATAWFALRNQTTNEELLRVTADGKVGIKESNPAEPFEVSRLGGTKFTYPSLDANTTAFFHCGSGAATSGSHIVTGSGNQGTGAIVFADTDAATSGRVLYDHSSDFMSFNTAGIERMRITSTGVDVTSGTLTGSVNVSGGTLTMENVALDNIKPLRIKNSAGTTLLAGYLLSTSNTDGTL